MLENNILDNCYIVAINLVPQIYEFLSNYGCIVSIMLSLMISYDYFLTNIAGSASEVTQRLNLLTLFLQ